MIFCTYRHFVCIFHIYKKYFLHIFHIFLLYLSKKFGKAGFCFSELFYFFQYTVHYAQFPQSFPQMDFYVSFVEFPDFISFPEEGKLFTSVFHPYMHIAMYMYALFTLTAKNAGAFPCSCILNYTVSPRMDFVA